MDAGWPDAFIARWIACIRAMTCSSFSCISHIMSPCCIHTCVWRIRDYHLKTITRAVFFLHTAFLILLCHERPADVTSPSFDNICQTPGIWRGQGYRRRQPAHEKAIKRAAVILRPSTLLKFHDLLKKRKYRLLYSSGRQRKAGAQRPFTGTHRRHRRTEKAEHSLWLP